MEPTRDAKPNHRRKTRDRRDDRDTRNSSPDAANADVDLLCGGEPVAEARADARSTGLLPGMEATASPAQMMGNALAQAVEFLHATERQRLRALVAADMEIANRLHTDDFQLINPAG